jgi:hypothetical protein
MEGSKLGGQWKVPSLVADGRFQAWWPLECSMLGGQWGSILLNGQWEVINLVVNGETFCLVASERFQCLVTLGRRNKNIPFTSHFSPHKILPNFFFIDFNFLLYHGFRPLFHFFPFFSFTYKLQSCISRYQVFFTFITKSILIEDFFPSLNS